MLLKKPVLMLSGSGPAAISPRAKLTAGSKPG